MLAVSYVTDSFDDEIVRLLRAGGIGVLPTDTIYGLSCLAVAHESVQKLHKLKDRAENKPYVILISDTAQLGELGIAASDTAPALKYWPGQLTLICPAGNAPAWLHKGTGALAVRQPDSLKLRDLIAKTGPIISTSANISGQTPAGPVSEARKYFGDKLDFYVDAGPLQGKASTIARPVKGKLEVLRQGAVRIEEKEDV